MYYLNGAGAADFDTAGAVTVEDSSGDQAKGLASSASAQNTVSFAYDYDTNDQAGLSAGVDKECIVLVEGDGLAAQAVATFTITRDAIINVVCAPGAETNA